MKIMTDLELEKLADRIIKAVKEAPKEWSDPVPLHGRASIFIMKPHRELYPELSQRREVMNILREVLNL